MANRVQPPLDGDAEFESLQSHVQYFERSSSSYQPTEDEFQFILHAMEHYYEPARVEVGNWSSYDNYIKSLYLLEFTSSPGYPYNKSQPTIGQWLGFNGITFDEERVRFLWAQVQQLMLDEEIDCYWRCFIKKEPHKRNKVESKRWRIIQCCPLDVQVLWQMLFSKLNDAEIVQSLSIPSAQGICLPYGGWKSYYYKWLSTGTTVGADKTAWDWTVQEWMIRLDLELRQRLSNGDAEWKRQAQKMYQNAFYNCKILLSNGMVYRQVKPGVMKSGSVNTISTNSHCQVMLHILYCLKKGVSLDPMVVAVGDDTLNHPIHVQDIPLLESFGVIIKTISADTLEFVGREWDKNGPRAMYSSKHLFALATQKDEFIPQTLDSYMREYVNTDMEYQFLLELAKELSLLGSVRSREYYKFWLDNPLARYIDY